MRSMKFSIPEDLKRELQAQARRESRGSDRVSESAIVRRALRRELALTKEVTS